MKKHAQKITKPYQAEESFVTLFNKVDEEIGDYLESIEDKMLKEKAMQNIVSMLEILKIINQKELQMLYGSVFNPEIYAQRSKAN